MSIGEIGSHSSFCHSKIGPHSERDGESQMSEDRNLPSDFSQEKFTLKSWIIEKKEGQTVSVGEANFFSSSGLGWELAEEEESHGSPGQIK